jgi:hypothetical protein
MLLIFNHILLSILQLLAVAVAVALQVVAQMALAVAVLAGI